MDELTATPRYDFPGTSDSYLIARETWADLVVTPAARRIADSIIADARNVHGPVVWITGNSYMPPGRDFTEAEEIWNDGFNHDGEAYAWLWEEIQDHLTAANVYLGSPDYDNALYAVDMNRWQARDDSDAAYDDINDEWEPVNDA